MVGALLLIVATLGSPGPFVLVNGTGASIEELAIRPANGSAPWRSVGGVALPARSRVSVPSPGGDLCAFDLRARLAGSEITWTSVNLCDVRIVTLNRRADGTLWVDYD
ncbi:hypothetical protein GGQ97_002513 [Sphingomonas kaistensis]|uniref:Uncharacterized protein n=1 Tax=Sphingomonas kaistensis TaxID=298708 RepID=A0A7X5Y8C6_9SPHN|nr:hypothetical protein [Sphingomonas kaistensis]NJC06720.1 hypothetical protein [Sphingomonas kaistensis]